MICERANELILDALVEPLASSDREALERHLAECESCRSEAAQYRELWQAVEALATPEPLPGSLERLEEAVAVEFGQSKPSWKWRTGWIGFAAAIVLLAAGGLLRIGLQSFVDTGREEIVAEDTRARFLMVMTETMEDPELSEMANREIQAWFASLLEGGVLEINTAVGVGASIGTPPEGPLLDGAISGMVVIRAANEQEARRIALTSPIIEYGGLIEIRPVE